MDFNEAIEKIKENKISIGIALIILIVLIASAFFFFPAQQENLIKIKVLDAKGSIVQGATLSYSFEEEKKEFISNSFGLIEFSVPQGTKINYSLSKEGFESFNESITVNNSMELEVNLIELPKAITKTIILQTLDGEILRKEATINFSCIGDVQAPESVTTSNGFAKVIEPEGCLKLLAGIELQGFESIKSQPIEMNAVKIYLEEKQASYGKIRVQTTDNAGNYLNGIEVKLFSAEGILVNEKTSFDGAAEFQQIETGSYYITVSDLAGAYANEKSSEFILGENEFIPIELILSREISSTLKLKVIDRETKAAVSNAEIQLIQSKTVIDGAKSNSKGEAEYSFFEEKKLNVLVNHAEYLLEEKEIQLKKGSNELIIELEKLTELRSEEH